MIKVNSLLQNHTTKASGFQLIVELLPQVGASVLDERGLIWLNTALKTCSQQSPSEAVGPAFTAILQLIRSSTGSPDFAKSISHTVIQKIFDCCSKTATVAALNCLIECMLTYPGPSGPSKAIVERVALQFVDCTEASRVLRAANCLFLMQATKSGGEQGQLHKKYYIEYQAQLVFAIHKLLDQLFAHFDESFEDERAEPDAELRLPELILPPEPVARIAKLIQRISNLLQFLNVSLLAPYPVVKPVRAAQILLLIRRGLAVNAKMITKNAIVDNLITGVLVPPLHIELFGTLNSLMLLCKGNLRLFAGDILEFFDSSLKWSTSGPSMGCKKPYTRLRTAVYKSLKLWTDLLGRSSLVEDLTDTLITSLINDTSPFKNEVKLQVFISKKYIRYTSLNNLGSLRLRLAFGHENFQNFLVTIRRVAN